MNPYTTQSTVPDLDQRANQLAHHRQILGIEPEVCAGMDVELSLEVIAGKACNMYVSLDLAYPRERAQKPDSSPVLGHDHA